MKWMSLVAVALAACATDRAARHARAPAAHAAYALVAVVTPPPRAGQLSASREWERANPNRAVHADDNAALRSAFVHRLAQDVPLDPRAPRRLVTTLTLQDTGYYEGLAAETTDVTLTAQVFDDAGNLVRTITLREPASAPLQRSASRKDRLQAAFGRLADRLAAQL